MYFNKKLLGSYNSTEGKYTGYTQKTIEIATALNKNTAFLEQEKKNLENCKQNIPKILKALEGAVVKPYVKLLSAETASSQHPGILVCSAYDFYPKHIRLTWLRNGKEVTSDVTSTDELSNGNWLYQRHSYLEYTAKPGDTFACIVEHASYSEPKLYTWEHTSESARNKITVGTAGLLLGLSLTIAGAIYYKKHTRGHVPVPKL